MPGEVGWSSFGAFGMVSISAWRQVVLSSLLLGC
jgi:hypothetical protein